jgi:hypothetical protein
MARYCPQKKDIVTMLTYLEKGSNDEKDSTSASAEQLEN